MTDPEEFEFWVFMVLIQLYFFHTHLNLVNLDIKPINIFVGELGLNTIDNKISMDLGSAMILDSNTPCDD